jgi:ribosome modulation factor
MARKLGKNAAAKADKPQTDRERIDETVKEVNASNVTPTTKREFLDEAKAAKIELDGKAAIRRAAAKQEAKANGAYRNVLKRAEQHGVSAHALSQTLAFMERDPVEVQKEIRDLNEMLTIAEYPLDGGQYGMFADGTTVSMRVDNAKQGIVTDTEIDAAKQAGLIAGKAGKSTDANPYKIDGSPENLAWEGARRDGQAENLAGLGRGPAPDVGATAH